MKKLATLLLTLAALTLAANAFAANTIRISQVYGGGGNTGAQYNQDYVELFNASGSAVNLGGYSLQYGSSTGTVALGACTNCTFVIPANTMIQPCSYLLIGLATAATSGVAIPYDITAPAATAINMSGTNGKIALAPTATNLLCGDATIVDLVGWGAANCFETAAMAVLSNTTAGFRAGAGMTDTDKNNLDFTTAAPAPRNAATGANQACLATPTAKTSWGSLKSIYR